MTRFRDAFGRGRAQRTPDDNAVTVPYSVIWSDRATDSNDGNQSLHYVADFHLLPCHDAAPVRSLLEDVALTSSFLGYAKPVRVVVHEEPWGTHYRLRAYPFDVATSSH